MKEVVALLFLLSVLPFSALAESGTIYNWQTGEHRFVDVDKKGERKYEVYDYKSSSFYDAEVSKRGDTVEVYDYRRGQFKEYDIEKQPDGSVEIYDWQKGSRLEFDWD